MKKKGLIISTVVMVVVLIASLTTATYAWFTSQSVTRVGDIEMSATSSNKLKIGAKMDMNPTTDSQINYASGTVTWDATNSEWTGPAGLGSQIDFMSADAALNFALDKAVTIENSKFIKANGEGSTITENTKEDAEQNVDYFDATIMVLPVAENTVKQAWCSIKITPTDEGKIGMAAAIRFSIKIGNAAAFTVDSYTGKTYAQGWTNDVTAGTYNNTDRTWTYDIELMPFNTANFYGNDFETDGVAIQITAWLEGTDDSCISANAGTGAKISISFDSSDSTKYTIANGVRA